MAQHQKDHIYIWHKSWTSRVRLLFLQQTHCSLLFASLIYGICHVSTFVSMWPWKNCNFLCTFEQSHARVEQEIKNELIINSDKRTPTISFWSRSPKNNSQGSLSPFDIFGVFATSLNAFTSVFFCWWQAIFATWLLFQFCKENIAKIWTILSTKKGVYDFFGWW